MVWEYILKTFLFGFAIIVSNDLILSMFKAVPLRYRNKVLLSRLFLAIYQLCRYFSAVNLLVLRLKEYHTEIMLSVVSGGAAYFYGWYSGFNWMNYLEFEWSRTVVVLLLILLFFVSSSMILLLVKLHDDESTRKRGLFDKISNYIDKASSTMVKSSKAKLELRKIVSQQKDEDIIASFLAQQGATTQDIIDKYSPSFDRLKNSVQEVSRAGLEKPVVHQLLKSLLSKIVFPCLQEGHIASYYSSQYEVPLDSTDPVSKDCRKLPDFSIHLASIYDNDNPTYLSAVVQIECKQYENVTDAVNQAAGYAMERLKCLVELYRDMDRDYECYSFGTDGDVMIVVRVALKNGKLTYASNKGRSDQSFLWPTNAADIASVSLHELGGMVALLSLLTFPQALKPKYAVHQVPHLRKEYEIVNVLGMGGFCSVFLVRNPEVGSDRIAIKFPIYWDHVNKNEIHQFARLSKEAEILESLSSIQDAEIDNSIPHIDGFYYSPLCIVYKEVGVSLQNYLAVNKKAILERRQFCENLEVTFTDILTRIYERTGITHRDIRPHNIVMFKINDNNDYRPLPIVGLSRNGCRSISFKLQSPLSSR
jgi:hypothetical protein